MTRKCAYCGVTYSVEYYGTCPFKCPGFSSAAGSFPYLSWLNVAGLTAAGIGQVVGEQEKFLLQQQPLQGQIKALQDLVVSQGKRIAELEEQLKPKSFPCKIPPNIPEVCKHCGGRVERFELVGTGYDYVICNVCAGRGVSIVIPSGKKKSQNNP